MFVDKCVCLTLDKRYDQFLEIKQTFSTKNIEVEPFICGDGQTNLKYDRIDDNELPPIYRGSTDYPTWHQRPATFNAWKCHREIFRQAVEDNVNSLLILEDDVFLEVDFDDYINIATDFMENNKWDAFYLGAFHKYARITYTNNPNIIKVYGSGGLHGVILNRRLMQTLVNYPPHGPYDYIMGRSIHWVFDCYSIFPSIVSQRNGYSYVEGVEQTKPSRYELPN